MVTHDDTVSHTVSVLAHRQVQIALLIDAARLERIKDLVLQLGATKGCHIRIFIIPSIEFCQKGH